MVHRNRRGITLIELIVTLGIIAVLIGLLVPAVAMIRAAAARTESQNNQRQLGFAIHHYATANAGRMPTVDGYGSGSKKPRPIFRAILPYIEEGNYVNVSTRNQGFLPIPTFISPADPTIAAAMAENVAVTSYAANANVFGTNRNLGSGFSDGTSNTIILAEHYAFDCGGARFMPFLVNLALGNVFHRPTFADVGDVYPVTSP